MILAGAPLKGKKTRNRFGIGGPLRVPYPSGMSITNYSQPLPTPEELLVQLPASDKALRTVQRGRSQIQKILGGKDRRFMIWLGPCSIHNTSEALEYARRVKALSGRVQDRLLLVMRCYLEKPRTTIGWKGLISEPDLNRRTCYEKGLKSARSLLLEIADMGVYACTEFLEPMAAEYTADLISTGAIGARTVESQIHRTMASGLPLPVGFKNGTDGSIQTAIDAMTAATSKHTCLGINAKGRLCEISTSGNPHTFVILRGGRSDTNYDHSNISAAIELLRKNHKSPAIMVDCSHGNSRKEYRNQSGVFKDVLRQRLSGNTSIVGVMLEGNLKEGAQTLANPRQLLPGISITDGCIGWEETAQLIDVTYTHMAQTA